MIIDLHANREFAMKAEGSVIKNGMHVIYKCPANKDTIGYGFNIQENNLPGVIASELVSIAAAESTKLDKKGYVVSASYSLKDHGISERIAQKLLDMCLRQSESELSKNVPFWDSLDFVRRQVLVDMCFNMGWPSLSGFKKMFKALEKGDYAEAASQMIDSKWFDDVGIRAEYLEDSMRRGIWVKYV